MSQIGTSKYYKYDYDGIGEVVSFINTNAQTTYANFYGDGTKVVYKDNFDANSPVFVPCTTAFPTSKLNESTVDYYNNEQNGTKYFNNGAWIEYDATSFSRSKAVNGFGTICSPVDATITGGTLYEVIGRKSGILYLREKASDATTLVAGTPYFYKASAATQTIALDGATYSANPSSANGLYGTYAKAEVATASNYFVL